MAPPDIYKLAQIWLSDGTVQGYTQDLQHILDWIRRQGLKPRLAPKELDSLLSQFAVEEFEKAPNGLGEEVFKRMKRRLEFYVP